MSHIGRMSEKSVRDYAGALEAVNENLQSELTAARDEIETLKASQVKTDNSQTLVNALEENEKLRGRVSELESLAADLVGAFDQTLTDTLMFEDYEALKRVVEPFRDAASNPKASAWLLRKQAEAVDSLTEEMDKVVEGRQAIGAVASSWIKERSKRLRTQADEMEHPDGRS